MVMGMSIPIPIQALGQQQTTHEQTTHGILVDETA